MKLEGNRTRTVNKRSDCLRPHVCNHCIITECIPDAVTSTLFDNLQKLYSRHAENDHYRDLDGTGQDLNCLDLQTACSTTLNAITIRPQALSEIFTNWQLLKARLTQLYCNPKKPPPTSHKIINTVIKQSLIGEQVINDRRRLVQISDNNRRILCEIQGKISRFNGLILR